MSGPHHYVSDRGLLQVVRSAIPAGPDRDAVVAAVERWLARQPTAPPLIGTTAAAKILGIPTPHVTRLRASGRMPEPVPVEGSVEAYRRDDVEELATALRAEREARRRKREEAAAREAAA